MCFNKEVSLTMFIFGLAVSVKLLSSGLSSLNGSSIYPDCVSVVNPQNQTLFNKTEVVTAIFIFFIALMQLNEYFLWTYQGSDPYSRKMNRFWSYMILFTLTSQVIAYYVANLQLGLLSSTNDSNKLISTNTIATGSMVCVILMSIFLVVSLFFLYRSETSGWLQTRPNTGTCRLLWSCFDARTTETNISTKLFRIFYLIALILLTWNNYGYMGIFIFAITIIPALAYTVAYQKDFNAVYGSIWCFSIISVCLLVGIFNFLPGHYLDISLLKQQQYSLTILYFSIAFLFLIFLYSRYRSRYIVFAGFMLAIAAIVTYSINL